MANVYGDRLLLWAPVTWKQSDSVIFVLWILCQVLILKLGFYRGYRRRVSITQCAILILRGVGLCIPRGHHLWVTRSPCHEAGDKVVAS